MVAAMSAKSPGIKEPDTVIDLLRETLISDSHEDDIAVLVLSNAMPV